MTQVPPEARKRGCFFYVESGHQTEIVSPYAVRMLHHCCFVQTASASDDAYIASILFA